jgi:hypothetical protein
LYDGENFLSQKRAASMLLSCPFANKKSNRDCWGSAIGENRRSPTPLGIVAIQGSLARRFGRYLCIIIEVVTTMVLNFTTKNVVHTVSKGLVRPHVMPRGFSAVLVSVGFTVA